MLPKLTMKATQSCFRKPNKSTEKTIPNENQDNLQDFNLL